MHESASPSDLSRHAFVERFGGVYEHSPWVAEAVFDAGLGVADDTVSYLAGRMRGTVDSASAEDKMTLIRAHPDLGARAEQRAHLTAASRAEQSGAGLAYCSESQYAELQSLNEAYTQRFGFPFIIAVRGLTRSDILNAMRARLGNDAAAERAHALSEIHRIAHARLADLLPG